MRHADTLELDDARWFITCLNKQGTCKNQTVIGRNGAFVRRPMRIFAGRRQCADCAALLPVFDTYNH